MKTTEDLMKEAFPPRPEERAAMGEAMLLGLCSFLAVMALCSLLFCGGCVYKGAKVTEGVDLAVGLTVPGSDGALQLNALNWLSGFRLGVAENALLTVEYSSVSTNSFFGCIYTKSEKHIKATVEPCETTAPTPETTPSANNVEADSPTTETAPASTASQTTIEAALPSA